MSLHLVILVHADPSVAPRYLRSLEDKLDEPVDLVLVNAGGFSSAYVRLAEKLRRLAKQSSNRCALLAELVRYAGAPRTLEGYETVTLASFSAGYALVRAVLADAPSSERLDGVVAIDSWHAGLEADGTARDSQLGGLVRFGLLAKEGPRVCWLAHTDVRTPQTGPVAFASTSQVATEVRRLTGLPGAGEDVSAGGLRVRAEDRYRSDHDEHVAALTEWGAPWLADAAVELLDRRDRLGVAVDDDPPPTQPGAPLGVRALKLSQAEQAAGVKERPGGEHHPRILEYLAGCMRDGKRIGKWLKTDETHWCAAAASWAAFTAAVEGEKVPHGWRAGVIELWLDALANGSARGASRIRRGEYVLQVGDLAILTRGGPAFGEGRDAFRRTNGQGHAARVAVVPGDDYRTLDANVGDQWSDVDRHIGDLSFVGAVSYPQLEPEVLVPTDDELEGFVALEAARLMGVSDSVMRGEHGLDWAMGELAGGSGAGHQVATSPPNLATSLTSADDS